MRQLTYCSNIHSGEAWADVLLNLDAHLLAVKNEFSPNQSFPLGLRISYQASQEINRLDMQDFRAWCEEHDCYLLTINGFPYGTFHNQSVKTAVYDPDWRTLERVNYTKRLADIAAAISIRAIDLSISTVPVAFKENFKESDWDNMRENFLEVLAHLAEIHERTKIKIRLAIEPEPLCVLETMEETIDFFTRMNFPEHLRDYVGICFDCCHQAVEFENPEQCLNQLREANIRILKVQVSSALRATGDEITQLIQFNEPIYLHQVVAKNIDSQQLTRFTDLPPFQHALNSGATYSECRAHFHVPIFLDHLGYCGTTRFFLEDFLPRLDADIPLEVETYSFQNLPHHLRKDSVSESIARELFWVRELLG